MPPNTLTFISLFSGIGGIDRGLEQAGMECVAQVEIDPYCLSVLSTHWPEVPKYGDVSDLSGSTLPAADAICGGFPCQPVSMAGRRQGKGDPRWLWPHFARLVGEIRPRYVIVENVPGIYSLGGTEVVADLATMGYDAEWGCVPAEAFGAPHKRERFVLVAYSGSWRRIGESEQQGQGSPKRGRVVNGGQEFVAYSDPDGWDGEGVHEGQREGVFQPPGSGGGGEYPGGIGSGEGEEVADPDTSGRNGGAREVGPRWRRQPSNRRVLRRPGAWDEYWRHDPADFPESGVGRVANGVPNRVDRIRSLGNSVVPQVFHWVGRTVMRDARERGYIA